MPQETDDLQKYQYLVVVQFQLNEECKLNDEPAGKIYLSGCYQQTPEGEEKFYLTLENFFARGILILRDMAIKLAQSRKDCS